jgi:hypothetical protein
MPAHVSSARLPAKLAARTRELATSILSVGPRGEPAVEDWLLGLRQLLGADASAAYGFALFAAFRDELNASSDTTIHGASLLHDPRRPPARLFDRAGCASRAGLIAHFWGRG